jgi:mRNA-degrading endonuclease RelE of RelBE toxin-antitoxin system
LDSLDEYDLRYEPDWDRHFSKLDSSVQTIILKKIRQLRQAIVGRHFCHGLPLFVEEVGGYRITYRSDDIARIRKVVFVGDHKQYEKWYQSQVKE